MRKPLPPQFVNMPARLAEHAEFMQRARFRWPGQPICPDCYQPLAYCTPNQLMVCQNVGPNRGS